MNDDKRLEMKVGLFALVGIASLVGLMFAVGEWSIGVRRTIAVAFAHTGNVVVGAPVRLAGVAVGRVAEVGLATPEASSSPMVRMRLSVTPQARAAMRSDARVTVSSQGPLGEPYLELWTGSAPTALGDDATIRGIDAPRIDVVSNRLAAFLDAASAVLEENPQALSELVRGAATAATSAAGVIEENRKDVRATVGELAAAAADLRAVARMARAELTAGGTLQSALGDAHTVTAALRADYAQWSKDATKALAGASALTGSFSSEDGQALKASVAHFSSAVERLDAMATRADRLLAAVESGQGTVGAALKDKQVYDELKALLSELRAKPWRLLWKD